jgi:ATP phosphoribosyltransferase
MSDDTRKRSGTTAHGSTGSGGPGSGTTADRAPHTSDREQSAGPLTLAVPKGRLEERVREHFAACGIHFEFKNRELVTQDQSGELRVILVKNSDLPVYVHNGIAGLGVCGYDVIYESGYEFYHLREFEFGSTKMCLAARRDLDPSTQSGELKVASKFTRFTRDLFHRRGIPVQVIKLGGSVELAPVLGLAPYIVDLVETGSTLRANNLAVIEELATIRVYLVANPGYYKFHHERIETFLRRING